MKTKSKSQVKTQSCELESRPDQFTTSTDTQPTAAPTVAAPAADHRPKIDLQKRAANRLLSTPQLLALLRAEAPQFFGLAEIVGKWVPVALYVRNDNHAAKLIKLVATCGPLDIDDPSPAITVMMPDED